MPAGGLAASCGDGVRLIDSRRLASEAPLSSGIAWAGSALRASPVPRLEASSNIARCSPPHSRSSAARSIAPSTLAIATTSATCITVSPSAASRPDAPSSASTASANPVADAEDKAFKSIEPIQELPPAAAATAIAAPRHGGATL